MPNPVNEKPEIQRQFFDGPLSSVIRRPSRDPGVVLVPDVRPVLENEGDQEKQQQRDQNPPAETTRCDYADQQPDGNRIDFEVGSDGNADGRASPPFSVDSSDGQQE